MLFLYELIEESFGFSFEEIERETERRLYNKLRYLNPMVHEERILYFSILRQKMNSQMNYLEQILESDNFSNQALIDVVEEIEGLFVFDSLQDKPNSLETIERLLKQHLRKNEIKEPYFSLIKNRRKVFEPYFDTVMLEL